jgi:hypothetical protein
MLLVVGLMFFSLALAFGAALLLALALVPLALRSPSGRNGVQWLTMRLAWGFGRWQGRHLYRSGPLGPASGGNFRLPGLAAPMSMSEWTDAHGRPFALLTVPSLWHHTVVLECHADGASLVDVEQIDTWVAYWGDWLAQLGHEPGLVGASVTVESSPDTGEHLVHEVYGHIHPDAPPLARQVLEDIVKDYPVGSAQLTTHIALTYSGAARNTGARRDLADLAESLGARLPGLSDSLLMTGAGPARALSASQMAWMVRTAFDPIAAELANFRGAALPALAWKDAGPAGAEETKDAYHHDSAWSITWSMSEAPRGEVFSTVLNRLVMPHPDIFRKRVTLVYRPHDPGTSARLVERDRKDALFKAKQGKVAQARDSVAVQAADLAAQEEATGAGLIRFGLYVTATVTQPDDLRLAASAIDNLAASSRIQLRRMYCAQATGFLSALPLGLVIPHHLRIPEGIRNAL